jgi:hypothetical protein
VQDRVVFGHEVVTDGDARLLEGVERDALVDLGVLADDGGTLVGPDGRPVGDLGAGPEPHVPDHAGELADLAVRAYLRVDTLGVELGLGVGPDADDGIVALGLVELDVALGELGVDLEDRALEVLLGRLDGRQPVGRRLVGESHRAGG